MVDMYSAKKYRNIVFDIGNTLGQVKNNLLNQKSELHAIYQGNEVPYFEACLSKSITEIDELIRELQSVGDDVVRTAERINRE